MLKLLFAIVILKITLGEMSNESDYVDPVIDLLLNGPSYESDSGDDIEGADPIISGGIWKCGNCTDITNSKLMYTEANEIDDIKASDHVDIQISLSLQGMRCVTVLADKPGVVQKVSGACDADMVTLHVSPTKQYIIRVYN